jgi:DNA-directed RNA polymerase beta subunit
MDKIQMRDSGNKNLYTHQPIGGRTTGSGIRAGEMEKDAFIGHGASAVQVERLMKSSDEFAIAVCGHCGVFINNKICTACDKSDPVMIHIPYTFKLLIQLLNGVGIQIKLKTQKKSM